MIALSSDYYSELRYRERRDVSSDPDIEFGLLCQGQIEEQLHFVTSLDEYNYRNYDFYPLTYSLDEKVSDFICSSHDKYRRRGYFTSPFLVRYLLRGYDGKCLYVSEPEVMTAGLLPPVIELLHYDDFDGNDMHLWLSGSPIFRLMMRIGKLPRRFAGKVKDIEIYATPQFLSFRFGGGHNCEYSEVLRSVDIKAGIHSRIDIPGYLKMFNGWYADSSGELRRHYTDTALANKKVWYVTPNNNLIEVLAEEDCFFHIATINHSELSSYSSFKVISIPSALNKWILANHILDEPEPAKDDIRLVSAKPLAAKKGSSRLRLHETDSAAPVTPKSTTSCNPDILYSFIFPDLSTSLPILQPSLRITPVFSSGLSPPPKRCSKIIGISCSSAFRERGKKNREHRHLLCNGASRR